jgi:hypothetical protein
MPVSTGSGLAAWVTRTARSAGLPSGSDPGPAADLGDFAERVAAKLGDGWAVDPDPDRAYAGPRLRRSANPDAPCVQLEWARQPGRIHASGCYPFARHPLPHGLPHPSINVRADRGAAVIARELRGRLLPGYLMTLERVTAADEQRRHDNDQRQQAAERLAKLLPEAGVRDDAKTVSGYLEGDPHRALQVRLNTDGTEASVEVSWVPVALAEQIVRICAGEQERP